MTTIESQIAQLVEQYFMPLICTGNQKPNATQAPGGICGVFYQGNNYYFPYGYIDANNTAPDENTVFGLGSVTKILTTSILGQQPQLFTEQVINYLPEGYTLTGNEQQVTFAQLATFTAGIDPSAPPPEYGGQNATQQDFINFIASINPAVLPAPNLYSDSSIGLLGQVLMNMDKISPLDDGASATTWLQQNLLTALSMNNTGSPAVNTASNPLSNAFTFNAVKNAYETIDYSPWTPWGTAGRAFSTCSDMMNFIQANCGVATINGNTVSQTILQGMVESQADWATATNPNSGFQQGFAWIVIPESSANKFKFCGKAGGVIGVSSFVTVCSNPQVGVIFLTNMRGVTTEQNAIALSKALQNL